MIPSMNMNIELGGLHAAIVAQIVDFKDVAPKVVSTGRSLPLARYVALRRGATYWKRTTLNYDQDLPTIGNARTTMQQVELCIAYCGCSIRRRSTATMCRHGSFAPRA